MGSKVTKLKVVKKSSLPKKKDADNTFSDVRKNILELKNSLDKSRWLLAEALFDVFDGNMFHRWGFNNFDQYVEVEVGLTTRTAQYLVSMYRWFVHKIGPKMPDDECKEMISEVKDLGWAKAKSLVKVTTPENVTRWIKKAKELSSEDLKIAVQDEYNKKKGIKDDDVKGMKGLNFGRVFVEQHDIVMQALAIAEKQAESDKKGHLISLVCQDFVATNMAQTEGGQRDRSKYFDKIAAQYGVKFIAVDIETGKVVHGNKLLDGLNKEGV